VSFTDWLTSKEETTSQGSSNKDLDDYADTSQTIFASLQYVDYDTGYVAVLPEHSATENALLQHGEYEPGVKRLIQEILEEGDIAIDLGAHTGHHTVSMREAVGQKGTVISVEPTPTRCSVLEKTVQKNDYENVIIVSAAISNHQGVIGLNQKGSPHLTDGQTDNTALRVITTTMNDLLQLLDANTVNLTKIDVEGGETNILKDISPKVFKTLIVEIHIEQIAETKGSQGLEEVSENIKQYDSVKTIPDRSPIPDITEYVKNAHRQGVKRQTILCQRRP
jgi:FkbM family methyltransferase